MRFALGAGACTALLLLLGATRPVSSTEEVIEVDQLPQPIHRVEAIYPPEAQEAGLDGSVLVQVHIMENGRVSETRVIRSVPMLDAAAVTAARQWRFKPAHGSTGKPMPVWAAIPFTFKIPVPPDEAHAEFLAAVSHLRGSLLGNEMWEPMRPPSTADEAAREHVIRLALRLKPRPTVLPDVRNLVRRAHAELDSLTADSKARALDTVSYALYRAPWFAAAYLEAARILEALDKPSNAAVALRLYLVADSTSSRRGEVERRLRDLRGAPKH